MYWKESAEGGENCPTLTISIYVHDTSWKHDNMQKQRPDVTKNMYNQNCGT